MTAWAVEIEGVEKSYPHFNLKNINLKIPHGQIMGLIGPNGAGKSTIIRILMGLVHQDRGEVMVLDQKMPAQQVEAKQLVGYVSEDMRLYKQATVQWHMDFIQSIYPSWDAAYAQELVHRFNLIPEQKIKGLSHGQRVKAGLLLVLARQPKLLILDEPTTGLDPVARYEVIAEMMDILADEERTILFSSHNTQDVENISDQITFIDQGQLIDSRDKEAFLERWRRLRVEVPAGADLPILPDVVQVNGNGRLRTITTDNYNEQLLASLQKEGFNIHAVDNMTLEEIFIANVKNKQEGVNA